MHPAIIWPYVLALQHPIFAKLGEEDLLLIGKRCPIFEEPGSIDATIAAGQESGHRMAFYDFGEVHLEQIARAGYSITAKFLLNGQILTRFAR